MKHKLRRVVVQDRLFWWVADWFYHPDQSRILRVRIWGRDKQSRPLRANLTSKWIEYPAYGSYPLPSDISAVIIYALAHGWKPDEHGEAHWLTEGQDQLELGNFLLTDVGHLPGAPGPLARKRNY
jgi:hypothetical protein